MPDKETATVFHITHRYGQLFLDVPVPIKPVNAVGDRVCYIDLGVRTFATVIDHNRGMVWEWGGRAAWRLHSKLRQWDQVQARVKEAKDQLEGFIDNRARNTLIHDEYVQFGDHLHRSHEEALGRCSRP
jgi:transposase